MWCIKLLIAVSEIDYHGIQNVEPFSDLGVLPDVISEDIGTTVEDFQCVKMWNRSPILGCYRMLSLKTSVRQLKTFSV